MRLCERVVLLTNTNGHSDTEQQARSTRHRCYEKPKGTFVSGCERLLQAGYVDGFYRGIFGNGTESSSWQTPKTMDFCFNVTSLVRSMTEYSTFRLTHVINRRHAEG